MLFALDVYKEPSSQYRDKDTMLRSKSTIARSTSIHSGTSPPSAAAIRGISYLDRLEKMPQLLSVHENQSLRYRAVRH